MDIFKLYERFRSMNNTHQAGFFRPVRDFVPAVHAVSMEIFDKLVSELEKNQRITDYLTPFYSSVSVAVVVTSDKEYAPFPEGYGAFSSLKILMKDDDSICADATCQAYKEGQCLTPEELAEFYPISENYKTINIHKVSDSKFSAATAHKTKKPSFKFPVCTQDGDGFQLAPKGVGVVKLNYYSKPVEPVLDYTEQIVGVDRNIAYKKDTSTQLQWDDTMLPIFLWKLTVYYGLFVSDQLKMQVKQLAGDIFEI